jgi:hypothetical protein
MEIHDREPQTEERLVWHKPEVQSLTVTLDTGFGRESFTDGNDKDPGRLEF